MNSIFTYCECGSREFITKPNHYDIYEIIDGRLAFQRSEPVDDEFVLYCRECGAEYTELSSLETSMTEQP